MKIKDMLTGPEKWTQRSMARDADGVGLVATNPNATCRCLVGWMLFCYDGDWDDYLRVSDRLKKQLGDVVAWNDQQQRTFSEVKALVEELDI